MLVKIEARILIFPGTDFHFPSTSVPRGTFLRLWLAVNAGRHAARRPPAAIDRYLLPAPHGAPAAVMLSVDGTDRQTDGRCYTMMTAASMASPMAGYQLR